MIFRIELPLVPSLNNAYASGNGKRRFKSKRATAWKDEAGWLVKQSHHPRIRGPYRFTILLPQEMEGDISNRIKLAEDLFVELDVTPDDKHAVEVVARRDASVSDGRCIIEVSAA